MTGLSARTILRWIGRSLAAILIMIVTLVVMYFLLLILPFWLSLLVVLSACLGAIYWIWREETRFAYGAMAVITLLLAWIFLVPMSVPGLQPLPVDPIEVTLSAGEEMVYFHITPTQLTDDAPILFVHGGPGGATTPAAIEFLQDVANATGRNVFTYDHYGGGRSSFENPNRPLLTIEDEVRRLNEIVAVIGVDPSDSERPSVIGHSYAGALIGRHIADHPGTFDKFVSLDTSPLFSLGGGNLRDQDLYNPDLQGLLDDANNSSTNGPGGFRVAREVFGNMSPREMIRGFYLIGPTIIGGDGYAPAKFGSSTEASYFLEKFLVTVSQAARFGAAEEVEFSAVGIAAQDVNASLAKSPDYSSDLVTVETPQVLSVHPEHGDIKWAIHKDYESFFPSIHFVPIVDGTHTNIYGNDDPPARQTLDAVVAFLREQPINGTHDRIEDPFG